MAGDERPSVLRVPGRAEGARTSEHPSRAKEGADPLGHQVAWFLLLLHDTNTLRNEIDACIHHAPLIAATKCGSCSAHHSRRRSQRASPPKKSHTMMKFGSPASARRRMNSPACSTP